MTIAERELLQVLDRLIASPNTAQWWLDLLDAWKKKAARDEGIY